MAIGGGWCVRPAGDDYEIARILDRRYRGSDRLPASRRLMSDPAQPLRPALRLLPFHDRYAATIERWVTTEQQLRWLAPGTTMPLTAKKVIGWQKPGGRAFVLVPQHDDAPLGYAELNPMQREPEHLWLGHAVIRPDARRQGIGKAFVQVLVRHAFERLGANRISLIVFPENTAAVECYRRAGFAPVREEYHAFGDDHTKHRFLRLEIRRSGPRPE